MNLVQGRRRTAGALTTQAYQEDVVADWREIDQLDLARAVIGALWHWRRLILVIVAGAAFVSLIVALNTPKQYRAYAQMAVLQKEADPLRTEQGFEQRFDDPTTIESEVKILQTRENYEAVADRLRLGDNPDFVEQPSGIARLFAGVGAAVRGRGRPSAEEEAEARREEAIKGLFENVGVVQVGLSRVIEIAVTTTSPPLAAEIANALMDAHIDAQIDRRRSDLDDAITVLETRQQALSGDVRRLEAERNALLDKQARVYDGDTVALAGLLERLELNLLEARIAAETARAEHDAVESAMEEGEWAAPPDDSTLVEDLSTDLARRKGVLAELSQQLGPKHPDFLAAKAAVSEIESSLTAAKQSIVFGLRTRLRLAEARLESAERAHSDLQDRLRTRAVNDVDMSILDRELADALNIFGEVSQRLDRMQERSAVLQPNVEIVGHASVPVDSIGPSRKLILAAGTLAGGVLSAILVLAFDWATQLIRRQGHARFASMGDMFELPAGKSKTPEDLVATPGRSPFADAVRAYAVATLAARPDRDESRGECIVVTSPGVGEGKTTVALSLARALAMEARRVLVVEGDRVHPHLTELAGCGEDGNGGDAASASGAAAHAAHPMMGGETRLTMHNGGPGDYRVRRDRFDLIDVAAAADETLGLGLSQSPPWDTLLSRAVAEYDVVILDTPGLFVRADSEALLRYADRCALVVRAGWTRKADLRSAYDVLATSDAAVTEVIYNGG